MTPTEFVDALRTYCFRFGGSVTSLGRTPAHNVAVGGVADSLHQVWLAGDVVYDAPQPLEARERTAARLGLRLVPESDHDHLQAL